MKTREQYHYDDRCADRAEEVIKLYTRGGNMNHPKRITADDIRDLMQDMLHWIARERDNYCCPECEGPGWGEPMRTLRECVETAIRDFPAELDEKYEQMKGQNQ